MTRKESKDLAASITRTELAELLYKLGKVSNAGPLYPGLAKLEYSARAAFIDLRNKYISD